MVGLSVVTDQLGVTLSVVTVHDAVPRERLYPTEANHSGSSPPPGNEPEEGVESALIID